MCVCLFFLFFQAEDGIRDLVRSRGLGDVYKRQDYDGLSQAATWTLFAAITIASVVPIVSIEYKEVQEKERLFHETFGVE